MKIIHVFYSGIVQGVGFRYTVKRCADQIGLTGWVRNVSDGRVELIAEGSEQNLRLLCKAIEDHFETNITDKQIKTSEGVSEFSSFEILA